MDVADCYIIIIILYYYISGPYISPFETNKIWYIWIENKYIVVVKQIILFEKNIF